MQRNTSAAPVAFSHSLRYVPLVAGRRGYVFPCDPTGRVELDCLSDMDRNDFLYAKHLVGMAFGVPCVEHIAPTSSQAIVPSH
jgi:hypothetical protein